MIQKKLTELKNILNYQLKQTIKNVDREFSKAPIDTGLMLKTTELVSITLNTDTLDVELNIKSQEYLKYVENGWGSNKKYGERRVRDRFLVELNNISWGGLTNNEKDIVIEYYLRETSKDEATMNTDK